MSQQLAYDLTENGYVPDLLVRQGIRVLLRQRLKEICDGGIESAASRQYSFIQGMNTSPVALLMEKANEQHYEVPREFYRYVLGQHLKYSSCYWAPGVETLDEAERAALQLTCDRAGIEDGMQILELGCGWGSLTLWIAEHYPNCTITAVSNSQSQRQYILEQAASLDLRNVRIITADMNDFEADGLYDRVVSVEMFEHMRNYREMFERISRWLQSDGMFFMHIFVHRANPYLFEDRDESDWMTRFFFSGGMMPSDDLPLMFQDSLRLERRWRWNGKHYRKTADAWLANLDGERDQVWPVLESTYGRDFAKTWYMRWRVFFLAVSELFGYNDGNEWYVSHYLFGKRG